MKKISSLCLIVAMVFGMSLAYVPALTPQADASVANWQKGVSVAPRWNTDFSSDSFKESLRDLKGTGANSVALIIPWYMSGDNVTIYDGGNTPTDASLIDGINYAHSLGLHVMLKPHLEAEGGYWRAYIKASNRNQWFANYSAKLNHLGDIAQQTGVEGISIGAELINMATYTSDPDNTQRWVDMINSLRRRFSGFLTYSANWGSGDFAEEVRHIGFWGSLDYIGISAYYPLAQGQWNPSVSALKDSWNSWYYSNIQPVQQQYGKPVLFTEIGYRSVDNAHNAPFDYGMGGGSNMQEQANDYDALFSYWDTQQSMMGTYLWDWSSDPHAGGQGTTDYTPQHKTAQDVMTRWFGGNGSSSDTGSTPTDNGGSTSTPSTPPNDNNQTSQATGDWIAVAQASGNQTGSSVNVSTTVSTNGQASNVIVDLEAYDASNNKVAQKFYGGQNFSENQQQQFQLSWTPQTAGDYTLRLGVFKNDWSQNFYWNNAVSTIPVTQANQSGQTQTPPPQTNPNPPSTPSQPVAGDTNIWWPSDGVSVTGVQPFKAMLTNNDVSNYHMFWQVDNGGLNEMSNSSQDYPHKEAWVDLSGWNWKGVGPYTINFVSKDNSGTMIGQKAININVR